MKPLTREQLVGRLTAEYDRKYYSPYFLFTTYRNRLCAALTSDRQMFLDIRHPESSSTERLQEIHDYIMSHNYLED